MNDLPRRAPPIRAAHDASNGATLSTLTDPPCFTIYQEPYLLAGSYLIIREDRKNTPLKSNLASDTRSEPRRFAQSFQSVRVILVFSLVLVDVYGLVEPSCLVGEQRT